MARSGTPAPGWYPDPDGTPSRERYWDGGQWSDQVRMAEASRPAASSARVPALVLGGLALLVAVLVLATMVLARQRESGGASIVDADPPLTPSASTPAPSVPVNCHGDGGLAQKRDGDRLVSGPLSLQAPAGWEDGGWKLPFVHEASGVNKAGPIGWVQYVQVGRLRRSEGFVNPAQAVEAFRDCLLTKDYYTSLREVKTLSNEPTNVSGKNAQRMSAEVLVGFHTAPGGHMTIIVVDTGDPDWLSLFQSGIVIGEAEDQKAADESEKTLKVA